MNLDIINFYADLNLQIPKLIAKRPPGITASQVEAAAEKVYSEIQAGYQIKPLNIARHIWNVGKGINADAYIQEQEILQNSKKIIVGLYKKIAEKNRIITNYSNGLKRIKQFYNRVLIYASIAVVLAVGLAAWEVIKCIL
jgi:hypothetical protein